MKKLRTILCLVAAACWALPSVAQYATTAFRLQSATAKLERTVGQTFTTSVTLPLNDLPVLSGLSLSGNASLLNEDDAYIGVTLLDTAGCEHLVYETYPLMADDLSCTLDDVALETAALDNVRPDSLKILLRNARLTIDALHYTGRTTAAGWQTQRKNLLTSQKSYTLERLDQHLRERNMTWSVGETCYSSLTFDEKRRLLGEGFNLMGGFEYYTGGIFVMPGALSVPAPKEADPFVKEFDWRNRHGKNWMTPPKTQSPKGCWAFGAVGPFEAYINIYYNRLLNYDLSEQDVMSCSGGQAYSIDSITGELEDKGGHTTYAIQYIEENGLVTEDCFPFQGPFTDCSEKQTYPGQEILSVDSYRMCDYWSGEGTSSDEIYIKRKLLKAPLCYSFRYDYPEESPWGHAVTLAGFKRVDLYDNIVLDFRQATQTLTIRPGNPLIGRTAWIVKNNADENWGEKGYAYLVTVAMTDQYFYELSGEVHSQILTNDSIAVTDADGDGYYCWGLGERPDNLPIGVPEEPDGDDSDPNYGPMDEYGNLQDIIKGEPLIIDKPTVYSVQKRYCHSDIIIKKGGILGIMTDLIMYKDAHIIVEDGGKLQVRGSITRADVDVMPGGALSLYNRTNCKLILDEDDEVNIAKGAECSFNGGQIIQMSDL